MPLTQGVVDSSDPWNLEPMMSPGEVSGTCPSSPSLRNSLRSAGLSAPTLIKNPEHMNAVASQHGEGAGQPQAGSTRLGAQVAFMDDYTQKISELLDREAQEGSKDIHQVGTLAVLAIKQEPQGLVMPAQAVVQNQQEVFVAVQGSLETSVYGGMTADERRLQGLSPSRVLHSLWPLGQVQTLLRF